MRSVWIFFLLVGGALSDVVIFRCCDVGLAFDGNKCQPTDQLDTLPTIYSPERQSFFPPGEKPHDMSVLTGRPQSCSNPTYIESPIDADVIPPVVLFSNGNAFIDHAAKFVHPGQYCFSQKGGLFCIDDRTSEDVGPEEAEPKITVRKCCGPSGAFSERNESCVLLDEPDPIEFNNLKTITGFPVCKEVGSFAIGGTLNTSHWIQEDGSLKVDTGHVLKSNQFCLEKIVEIPEEPPHVFTCPLPKKIKENRDIRFTLYPIGLFLSVFFLAVTLIASFLLPSTYHVLHWRCQTNHVACLLIGDLLLAVTQLSGDSLQGPACITIAIAMHFIFLAAFFWLNTMCFNIWWTFRDLRPASLDKSQEACRLRVYELYAWGGPLAIAGVAAVMDHLPDGSHPTFLRPRFGHHRCWFYGDAELLSYFYGPIGVLLLLNLTLFAATARELTCGLWKTEVVKSNTERATLGRVCLKLVVVMGVTWVADVVSWAVGGPDYVWYLTDLINALQGVLIFIVVGCQPQVWSAVKRLWCLRDSPNDTNHIRSSSSNALPSMGDHNTSTTKAAETLC